MSANWNASQFIHLSNSLSNAFLGVVSEGQVPEVKQQRSRTVKALIGMIRARLQRLSKFLLQSFRSKQSCSDQALEDEWTTEALIRMSQAKSSAFFVDH